MKLDVIVPIYNEDDSINNFYREITNTLKDINYKLIFVNDGSTDKTGFILKELYKKDKKHIKIINFSKNFGKESAMYAGLCSSKSDAAVIIDADLQQDPKYILQMLEALEEDNSIDAVCMTQNENKNRFFQKMFYKIINKMSNTKFVNGASDFRMFRKYVVKSIVSLSENNRFSKGIFSWVGYNTLYLPYEVKKRENGKSKWNFKSLSRYAIDGIIGYSTSPLELPIYTGIIFTLISFIMFIINIVKTISKTDVSPYSWIILLILFISGIIFFFLGIIGIYLGKSYLEVKNRPIYIEKERIGFDEENLL